MKILKDDFFESLYIPEGEGKENYSSIATTNPKSRFISTRDSFTKVHE